MKTLLKLVALATLTISATLTASAQARSPEDDQNSTAIELQRRRLESSPTSAKTQSRTRVEIQNGVEAPLPMGDGNFTFVLSEMSFGGKAVKNAPYSAEATTETVQTLADGNRIVHKTTTLVYRDSEGRTRRDQTLNAIGPYAVAGEARQIITINDPVAGVNYVLNPKNHVAQKSKPFVFDFKIGELPNGVRIEKNVRIEKRDKDGNVTIITTPDAQDAPHPPAPPSMPAPPAIPAAPMGGEFFVYNYSSADSKNAKRESLGTQTIEGVTAEGTRVTTTIPAGQIGNERDIVTIDERWYSKDLQVLVQSKHSDPRFGETTYRLTNINRSEPSPSLFQVPSDYTVKEMTMPGAQIMRQRIEKKENKQ